MSFAVSFDKSPIGRSDELADRRELHALRLLWEAAPERVTVADMLRADYLGVMIALSRWAVRAGR
jgi:hypothetical protein